MNYIRIDIHKTDANRPGGEYAMLEHQVIRAAHMADAREHLAKLYGKAPGERNKIYQEYRTDEDAPGTYPRSRAIGFTHSYWNRYGGKARYQRDWVQFTEVTERDAYVEK